MSDKPKQPDRRDFVVLAAKVGMAGGLVAGYGTCATIAGRYLYPSGDPLTRWLYVARAVEIGADAALDYVSPSGEPVTIARQKPGDTDDAFIALSSTCPHLGCKVSWQPNQSRFFCPCHNGAFDPEGNPIAGPPAKAGQSLARFPLKIENGLLYIEVADDGADGVEVGCLAGDDAAGSEVT